MSKKTKTISIVLAALLLIGAIGAIANKNNADDVPEESSTYVVQESSTESVVQEISIQDAADASVPDTTEMTQKEATGSNEQTAPYTETMLNVGQGLSVLFEADGKYMLYDGGGRATSSYVVAYLKEHGITHLDLMVASHYDEDHIAGLVGVLNTTSVDKVICPDYETDTKIYQSFMEKLSANGAEVIHPSAQDTFELGGATVSVLLAEKEADDNNDKSICCKISYGAFSSIITGDAGLEPEWEMLNSGLDLSTDLYVAGHHGSDTANGSAFVGALSPAYVFISCGENNTYGHPVASVMDTFQQDECKVFRSDKQQEVTCYSDGQTYWFSKDPTDDFTAGTVQEQPSDVAAEETVTEEVSVSDSAAVADETGTTSTITYALNTSTMKIHYRSCSSVKKIADKNLAYSEKSVYELEQEGYTPCGRCHPN